MGLTFWKMSGAGNDFIMVDGRNRESGPIHREMIAELCARGLSVGADGLIEILGSRGAAFMMRYYNSDGGRAEMCGNGARCICRFAAHLDLVPMNGEFLFESDAGIHRGIVLSDTEARIWTTEPRVHWLERPLSDPPGLVASFLDTGVPHCVVFAGDMEDGSFEELAPLVRRSLDMGEAGANADWVMVQPDGSLSMRTWERGVEGETLACGTGAVASALAAAEIFENVTLPVEIRVRSGRTLTVGRDHSGWWLQGEARIVYRGELLP
ncbi:MAG TPA: diaminopimelate epimerase [Candidatus Sabulitectum sp.]|nr:diaminopimelate epimerase [Candidatus Sabulitectum sp.]